MTFIKPKLKFDFFYLEDMAQGHQNCTRLYSQANSQKMVILAFIRAKLPGGGGQILSFPPSRARNSEPHSLARVNNEH